VHRIGHHFPRNVVEEACQDLGFIIHGDRIYEGRRRKVGNKMTHQLAQSMAAFQEKKQRTGRPATENETKEQIGAAIRELFPKIPPGDMDAIIARAFGGEGTVGNAKDLTLPRRVQLAVGAHIRHKYTPYDDLLRHPGAQGDGRTVWQQARTTVEPLTLSKMKEWRDEDDSGELEETFREIIILDDDGDDDPNSKSKESESSSDDAYHTADEAEAAFMIDSRPALPYELEQHYFAQQHQNVIPRPTRTSFGRIYIPQPYAQSSTLCGYADFSNLSYRGLPISSDIARPVQRSVDLPSTNRTFNINRSRRLDQIDNLSVSRPLQQIQDSDGKVYNVSARGCVQLKPNLSTSLLRCLTY
jgi:hypothetical protein